MLVCISAWRHTLWKWLLERWIHSASMWKRIRTLPFMSRGRDCVSFWICKQGPFALIRHRSCALLLKSWAAFCSFFLPLDCHGGRCISTIEIIIFFIGKKKKENVCKYFENIHLIMCAFNGTSIFLIVNECYDKIESNFY